MGSSSPSQNFSFMPSKVKTKLAQLPSMGIIPLFKKQDQDKNICIATLNLWVDVSAYIICDFTLEKLAMQRCTEVGK